MKPEKAIPITIVSGFLGSGKTSLINHALRTDCLQCQSVLINDYGAVKLDTHLVSPHGVVQLIHGCICCSSRRSLPNAIKQLITISPLPKRILIEASSLADPCAIRDALETSGLKTVVAVQQIITIVAADQILDLKGEMAQLAKMQLACANLVIVNKIDLVSKEQLKRVLEVVQAVKTDIPVLTTSHGAVPTEFLQEARVQKPIVSEEINHDSKP